MITRSVGTVEPTTSMESLPGTLLLDGREVLRDQYPKLWRWILEHNLVRFGLFTAGDGRTTFGLPDLTKRTPAPGYWGPEVATVRINFLIHTGEEHS